MENSKSSKEKSNNWIYMIGAIRECPVNSRDHQCCYLPFGKMNLKEASDSLEFIPEDKKSEMVNYCKQCSYLKRNLRQE